VEVFKGRIATDHLVGEDSRQPRVGRSVEQFRFTDGQEQTLGGGSVGAAVLFAQLKILLQREFFLACGLETLLEVAKDTHDVTSLDTWSRRRITQSMLAATAQAVAVYPPELSRS